VAVFSRILGTFFGRDTHSDPHFASIAFFRSFAVPQNRTRGVVKMAQPNRPKDCPLFRAGNGQWCKKIKGKRRYFGTDLNAALVRWAEEKDHLIAGLEPPRTDHSPTVAELANLYLEASRQKVAAGEVRSDHTMHQERVLARLIASLGKDRKLSRTTPSDWDKVRADLLLPDPKTNRKGLKRRAPSTIALDLARYRAFLNWCKLKKHVGEIDLGGALAPPPKRQMRAAKNASGKRLWQPEDLRKMIDDADVLFKPIVLLSINAAMGIADIALLKRSQITAKTEYLDSARNKTGISRKVWLWDETREAIAAAVAKRPEPAKQIYKDRLLLTKSGLPWHRVERGFARDLSTHITNRMTAEIGTAMRLYDCRRTFRTVASDCCDLEAINAAMGHAGRGEGATYMQGISDARIRRVCETVHTWLYK
jgi:integrase